MLQRKLPEGMTLTELPRTSCTPEAPERFRIRRLCGPPATQSPNLKSPTIVDRIKAVYGRAS
jgi:hypothetical protein